MLKYTLDDLEGVDEAHKPLYSEAEGGGFVLKVEGVVPSSKFKELSQKNVDLAEENGRRRRASEKWKELGESPDEVRARLDAKAKPDTDNEAVIAQIKSEYEAKLSDASSQVAKMRNGQAQGQFKAELAKAGFHPEVIDDIAAGSSGRLMFDDDGNMRIMSADGSKPMAGSGTDGYANIHDLALELAAAKPSFLKDEGKGGGGKPPASNSGGSPTGNRMSEILSGLPVN